MAVMPLGIMLGFGLVSCGDQISDVVNGITNEATAAVTSTTEGYQAPSTADPYVYVSSGQQLSEHQLVSIFYLAWPQSGEAVYSLLGPPNNRSGAYDYYVMPNGNAMAIEYNANGFAIDYHLGDSN